MSAAQAQVEGFEVSVCIKRLHSVRVSYCHHAEKQSFCMHSSDSDHVAQAPSDQASLRFIPLWHALSM